MAGGGAAECRGCDALRKLGPEVAARLLRHGYITAMCNLHVVFGGADEFGGWPLLGVPGWKG